jgi:MraZ protein
MTDPEARAIRRVLFGGASEVSIDSNGRILLPSFLREYAELDGESFLVGVGEYFEIWRADAWEHELVDVMDADVNAKRFTDFDISSG